MESFHHGLELVDLAARPAGVNLGRKARMRREEPEGAVAPVVVEALGSKEGVVGVMVDRLQLHGGDAEAGEMIDRSRSREAGICAAQLRRDVGVALAEALDVRLVDDRVGVGDRRGGVGAPIEITSHNEAPRHVGRRVQGAHGVGIAGHVAGHGVAPGHVAVDGQGVRVEEQLVGVAAKPSCRLVRPKYAVTVGLAGPHARNEAVPDAAVLLLERQLAFRRLTHRRDTARCPRRRPRRPRIRCRQVKVWRPAGRAGPAIARISADLPRGSVHIETQPAIQRRGRPGSTSSGIFVWAACSWPAGASQYQP